MPCYATNPLVSYALAMRFLLPHFTERAGNRRSKRNAGPPHQGFPFLGIDMRRQPEPSVIIWKLLSGAMLWRLVLVASVTTWLACSNGLPSGVDPRRDLEETLFDEYPSGAARLISYKVIGAATEGDVCTVHWEADVGLTRESGQYPQIQTWRGESQYQRQGDAWVHIKDEHTFVSMRPFPEEEDKLRR